MGSTTNRMPRVRGGTSPQGTPPIAVAEDDAFARDLIEEAANEANLPVPLLLFSDGADLLDYLYRRGVHSSQRDAPLPGAILLDLHMPRTGGQEVLRTLRSDPRFRSLPVLVLSASADDSEAEACRRAGASSFLSKPLRFEGFLGVLQLAYTHWTRYLGSNPLAGPGPREARP